MEAAGYEWPWPKGPGADHIHRRQLELADLLSERIPVFLDTNFWVMAREAALDDAPEPELVSLLGALRLAVGSGKVFFPVTSDLIIEFSKQSPDRLDGTMMLVDALSLGVAMIPHNERVVREMETFNGGTFPDYPPVERPLWTKFAFAFGYEDLRPANVEVGDDLLVALAEKAWMTQPSILAQSLPAEAFEARAESERIAELLNVGADLHAHEIDSHATALRIEIAGASSLLQGVAAREYRRMAAAAGAASEAADIPNSHTVGAQMTAMIAKGLESDRHRLHFGSLYVPAMLHAAVRSGSKRRLRPNDIFDFRHAAAALPHCRAFLTDGPLRSLIQSGHVALDRLYGCEVVSTPDDAIKLILRILEL